MLRDDNYSEHAYLETHHVMFGQGRRDKAEADGLTVRLCTDHLLMGIIKLMMFTVAAVPMATVGVIAALLYIFAAFLVIGWVGEIMDRMKGGG